MSTKNQDEIMYFVSPSTGRILDSACLVEGIYVSPYGANLDAMMKSYNLNDLRICNYQESTEIYMNYHYDLNEFFEIDEDFYEEMLNVLPPQNWRIVESVSIFRLSEELGYGYSKFYLKLKNRFFEVIMNSSVSYEMILKDFNFFLENQGLVEKESFALSFFNKMLDEGVEFPEASFRVLSQFRLSSSEMDYLKSQI